MTNVTDRPTVDITKLDPVQKRLIWQNVDDDTRALIAQINQDIGEGLAGMVDEQPGIFLDRELVKRCLS